MKDTAKWALRSDLAIEAVGQLVGEAEGKYPKGVKYSESVKKGVKVTTIDVEKKGEALMGKKAGRYVSLDTDALVNGDEEGMEQAVEILAGELGRMLRHRGIAKKASCLVVGLGNEHVTPDALGPLVVDEIAVTRHLFELAPDEVDPRYRQVSALSPGVMGMTGIETYDVIESVVRKTKPDFLVIVDALASRSVTRINRMIQMTDTGISPGAGVGNRRRAVDEASLGIPVIAIGVPTVVDAISITSDTVDMMLRHLGTALLAEDSKKSAKKGGKVQTSGNQSFPSQEETEKYLGLFGLMGDQEKRQLISEVLTPKGYNLLVTPKEIGTEIRDLAALVSAGVNKALHPGVEFS